MAIKHDTTDTTEFTEGLQWVNLSHEIYASRLAHHLSVLCSLPNILTDIHIDRREAYAKIHGKLVIEYVVWIQETHIRKIEVKESHNLYHLSSVGGMFLSNFKRYYVLRKELL